MYLCGQFLSPWANKEWMNMEDIDGRLRFVLEVMDGLKGNREKYPLM
jgi:2,4-dienoyl-CoA reductase-like NADH-dependent reductase (Old Yellow Enzyme family)